MGIMFQHSLKNSVLSFFLSSLFVSCGFIENRNHAFKSRKKELEEKKAIFVELVEYCNEVDTFDTKLLLHSPLNYDWVVLESYIVPGVNGTIPYYLNTETIVPEVIRLNLKQNEIAYVEIEPTVIKFSTWFSPTGKFESEIWYKRTAEKMPNQSEFEASFQNENAKKWLKSIDEEWFVYGETF